MIVKELMSTSVCFVKADGTVSDAVALMKKYDIGFVPVCDNKGCLIGLVTDRDIVIRALTEDSTGKQQSSVSCPANQIPISHIMTTDLVTVTSDRNVHDAALLFSEKGVRRLPVLENGRLAGVLSLSDLARKRVFLAEIGDIMNSITKRFT